MTVFNQLIEVVGNLGGVATSNSRRQIHSSHCDNIFELGYGQDFSLGGVHQGILYHVFCFFSVFCVKLQTT